MNNENTKEKKTKKEGVMSDMMLHYLEIKRQYPDCVIFYRLGDFYEMFFEDAVEVSKLLELTLTGRDCGLKERAPMCGIPFHAADGYIAKLVSFGKKVAICEQLSDPALSKGLVLRDVVKIVTGGTVTEDKYVDEKSNNFILAISKKNKAYAISWADITTGEFFCQLAVSRADALDVLLRVNPAQIICDGGFNAEYSEYPESVKSLLKTPEVYKEKAFDKKSAEKVVSEHFDSDDETFFVSPDSADVLCAAGAVLSYLSETQRHVIKNVKSLKFIDDKKYMKLDTNALRNLEITSSLRGGKYGSLLWAIDRTVTAGGGRRLKAIIQTPLRDKNAINYRLDGVTELFNDNLRREAIIETLKNVKDLARLCGRISNDIVTPRDCEYIKNTLACAPVVKMQLSGMDSQILKEICKAMGDFHELQNIIDKIIKENAPVSFKEGRFVNKGFDEELDRYRKIDEDGRSAINEFEERERNATGIRTLKIRYNKVFGYCIEVSNSFVDQVPYNYVRRQTLVGGERFITEELKRLEEEILTAADKALKIELEIYDKLKKVLIDNLSALLNLAKAFSSLDVLCSLASVARSRNYCRPEIVAADKPMSIVGGRHAVLEANSKTKFIPNDTYLDNEENRMMIITGPNMAGKSTYMRQVALIAVMAQIGSFVPAKEAIIPIIDRVFTRVGASDNIMFNQSTFMVEMAEVADIMRYATKESLVVLDEIGRGTSTFDGLSIAWAVTEYLVNKVKVKSLFATHYHELTELENVLEGVKNYKIGVKEINGEIVFLRKIQQGCANKSFGIEVAALAGVPKEITDSAKKILRRLEKNDLAVSAKGDDETDEPIKNSFVEEYLKRLDINNLTPLKAFEILNYLKDKSDGED